MPRIMTPEEFQQTQSATMSPEDFQKFQASHPAPLPAWKQAIAKYGPTVAKTVGAVGGGAVGSALGPGGTAAGGTLGYLGAQEGEKSLEQYLGIQKPTTLPQEALSTAQSIPEAASANMGGMALGTAASRALPVASRVAGRALTKYLGLKPGELEELGKILKGEPEEPAPTWPKGGLPESNIPPETPAPPVKTTTFGAEKAPAPGPGVETTPPTSSSDLEQIMQSQRTPQVEGINQPSTLASAPSAPQSEVENVIAGSKSVSPELAGKYGVTPESQALDIQDMLHKPAVPLSMKDVLSNRLAKYGTNAPQLNNVQKVQSPLQNILEQRSPENDALRQRTEDIINRARSQNKNIDAEMRARSVSEAQNDLRPSRAQDTSNIVQNAGMRIEGVTPEANLPAKLHGKGDLVMFTDPKTGSTLAMHEADITPETLQAHIAESRTKFGVQE